MVFGMLLRIVFWLMVCCMVVFRCFLNLLGMLILVDKMMGDKLVCLNCKKIFFDDLPVFQSGIVLSCPWCLCFGRYMLFEEYKKLKKKNKKIGGRK